MSHSASFCLCTVQVSELPSCFTIEAEIIVKEVARDDSLSLHVSSLSELKARFPKGQSTLGFVWTDSEGGRWTLCLYPNGDNLSREGQLGIFVKVSSSSSSGSSSSSSNSSNGIHSDECWIAYTLRVLYLLLLLTLFLCA